MRVTIGSTRHSRPVGHRDATCAGRSPIARGRRPRLRHPDTYHVDPRSPTPTSPPPSCRRTAGGSGPTRRPLGGRRPPGLRPAAGLRGQAAGGSAAIGSPCVHPDPEHCAGHAAHACASSSYLSSPARRAARSASRRTAQGPLGSSRRSRRTQLAGNWHPLIKPLCRFARLAQTQKHRLAAMRVPGPTGRPALP